MKVKKLDKVAKLPTRATEYSAGYDLYAVSACSVQAHGKCSVGTGIAVEIPEGYFGAIFARSGLATKQGLRPANCVGVIDSDYRGEVKVVLYNDSSENRLISTGSRIAQMVIIPCNTDDVEEVEELSDTIRGEGGFGSTGV